jgi:plasmid stabilization system protein ParE
MRVRYRERALADLEDIFRFLDERSPVGARKVIEAIHGAIMSAAEHPLSARETSDPAIRVKIVGRFHYKIFYGVGADEIEILHVRQALVVPG